MSEEQTRDLHVELTAVREQLKIALDGWHKAREEFEKALAELTQLQAIRDKASEGKVQCEDCGSILARWV